MVDEPEDTPLMISEEEVVEPTLNLPSVLVEKYFAQGFEGDKDFGFVYEEPPLATLPMSLVAPAAASQDEPGPSNKGRMKQITIEVPEGINLLMKPDRATVWLKPLIVPLEREKLDSHSSITLMNDVIHSALKVCFSTFNPFVSPFPRYITSFLFLYFL